MTNYACPKLPYKPLVAKRLGQIAELTEIACTYLEDTGDDSLRAHIPTLELHHQSNMDAALRLLKGAKKARVLHNTLEFAKNLYKAKIVDDLEKSATSARKLLRWLEPDQDHAGDPELIVTFAISKLVVAVVGSRQRHHSDEFRNPGRDEPLHFEANISLLFEALDDHCHWSHEGFFVRGLLGCLKRKRTVALQDSDDENTSDAQPMQKKRRSKLSGLSKQDGNSDTRDRSGVQADVSLSRDEDPQSSGEDKSENTGFRAIRTKIPWILASCTTCEKKIACGPNNQTQQCVACRRKAQVHSVVHQQRPAPTAVMVAPPAVMAPPRFAATAVMVAPTQLSEQPSQLQSAQVQGDSSKIEILEQRIWRQEIEKDGLKAMVNEQRGEYALQKGEWKRAHEENARQKSELESLRRENAQLKARNQQLEQQA